MVFLQAKVLKNGEGKSFVQDAQGNIIYPCGYRGGAKQRMSAVADFEDAEVSLSSQTGIAQVDKDKEFQVIFHAIFKEIQSTAAHSTR
jgi:hypothetical protein